MMKNTFAIFTVLSFFISITACERQQNQPQKSTSSKIETNNISGKFTPPDNKILLFIGQDSDTISNYIAAVPEDNIEGVTLYSQVKSAQPSETLKAIFLPSSWQSGSVDFTKTLAESPNASIAVGLAFDNCNQVNHQANIANGLYNETIDVMVKHFKSLAPRKVFLRIGYEFDGPWNCYTPKDYKLAFQRIAKAITKQNADNIATVWQSASWPDSYGNPIYDTSLDGHLNTWYPGDEYVDWIGMSVFYRNLSQWNYVPPSTPQAVQEAMLVFAKAHQKPVMIAESAPQGFRISELTNSVIQENKPEPVTAEQIWQTWYQPYFDFIYANNDVIKAVAYINTHWDSQGKWQCTEGIAAGSSGCSQGNWGDSRIQANDEIKARWLEQITNSNTWIQTSDY
ncbi:MAG: hypothetical protein HRT54_20100 [Colwellia sp.]|nr:hypothetical protein [Colwellia sp.]